MDDGGSGKGDGGGGGKGEDEGAGDEVHIGSEWRMGERRGGGETRVLGASDEGGGEVEGRSGGGVEDRRRDDVGGGARGQFKQAMWREGGREVEVESTMRREGEEREDEEKLMEAAGRMWVKGVKVDLRRMYEGERRRRVSLPTYPFERRRFWIDPQNLKSRGRSSEKEPEQNADKLVAHSATGGNVLADKKYTAQGMIEALQGIIIERSSDEAKRTSHNATTDGKREVRAPATAAERIITQQLQVMNEIMSGQIDLLRNGRSTKATPRASKPSRPASSQSANLLTHGSGAINTPQNGSARLAHLIKLMLSLM